MSFINRFNSLFERRSSSSVVGMFFSEIEDYTQSLKLNSVRAIGNTLSKVSDAYFLGLPKTLVPLVSEYVYRFRDPRKYYDYQPEFDYGVDEISEGALSELDDFPFYTRHSNMPAYCFQFINHSDIYNFGILRNEYYEIEYAKYYFFNSPTDTPVGNFHRMYCRSCIKEICDAFKFRDDGESENVASTSMEPKSASTDVVGSTLGNLDTEDIRINRPGDNKPLRLRTIHDLYPEDFKTMAEGFNRITDDLVRIILSKNERSSRRYLSDVISIQSPEHAIRVRQVLANAARDHCTRGEFFIWRFEGSHTHVVHDCSYAGSTCRCPFFNDASIYRFLRKPLRSRKRVHELGALDWINILLYFAVHKGTSPGQIWLNKNLQGSNSSTPVIQWQENVLGWEQSVLEFQRNRLPIHDVSELGNSWVGQTVDRRSEPASKRKRSNFEKVVEEVSSLLVKYCPVPLIGIKNLIPPNHADFRTILFDPRNKDNYISACDIHALHLNKYSFKEFHELYSQADNPIFYANNLDPYEYYHSRDTSLYFLDELLKFQLKGEEEIIKPFLSNLRNWFNREGLDGNPKMNALCVIGPPNSGKNYFFDAIIALANNVGHIGRVNNKTNNFALQDVVNRRIVVGNEISMEEGAKEDFKKLCEGTAFNVRVKFKADCIFTKTPVLLISNNELDICWDPHFKDVRLKTIRWNTAPLLAASNKKPYPLAMYDLFDKYNVSY
uniref:Nonstructural protein n=1 Tax=Planococcus citri densovirus TaxID=159153 RepID=A0A218L3L8_9VIRU|nr:nonstructural protein [Planococcus citri densovirus]